MITAKVAIAQRVALLSVLHEEVLELAQEHPDRVYQRLGNAGCSYNPDENNPDGCIIGAALRRAGWDTAQHEGPLGPVLAELICTRQGVSVEWWEGGAYLSRRVQHMVQWLRTVQTLQDTGSTWGQAVEQAEAAHPWEAEHV